MGNGEVGASVCCRDRGIDEIAKLQKPIKVAAFLAVVVPLVFDGDECDDAIQWNSRVLKFATDDASYLIELL